MGWTICIEDENGNGNAKKTTPGEFVLSDEEVFYSKPFRLLKYIGPYGDTTFNAFMFEDLIKDLIELIELLPDDKVQIDDIIKYAQECDEDVHTYLKFYGD